MTAALTHPTSANLLPWMQQQCESGRAQLWRMRDTWDCLYVITRVDFDPLEWCVCYVRGSGLVKFAPWFVGVARAKGWRMRMHTESLATVRLAKRLGFELAEYVMRL